MYCQFASVSNSGAIERDGVAALSELSELARRTQRTVAVLAASDVTLLRVKVPPMSAARLKVALPNLVEDQLMSDPAECVIVAGAARDEFRTVAVVQRSWLELISSGLSALGARHVTAIPAQLCLPYQDGAAAALISEYGAEIEVAVRMSEQEGIGLPIFADQPESAPVEAIQSLSAVVPQAPITLYVPAAHVPLYHDALATVPAQQERITLEADDWTRWIEGSGQASIDLMTGLSASAAGPRINWRPWRWPLALAAVLLAVNAAALNIDWMRGKREAQALENGMIQTYKAAFPKEPVIIDPLAQMRQKFAAAQRQSGQAASDDFIALVAAFSEAWAAAGQGPQAIAGLEYRDRGLSVKLKPGSNAPLEKIQSALGARHLSVTQPSTGVWLIRSSK